MKKTVLAFCLLLLLAGKPSLSQSKELHPGDKVPNLSLSISTPDNIAKIIKLYNIKKKLIILDFWSIYCVSCLESFPKLDSLQEKLKDNVQIIAINSESKKETLKFFEKHTQFRKPNLTMIFGDTTLPNYFPRSFVPWQIWIDKDKVIRFITNGYNATEQNISKFLTGTMPEMGQLTYYDDYMGDKPLIAEGNGRFANRALYFSYIIPCIQGATAHNFGGGDEDGMGKSLRLSRNCASIRRLFTSAFEEGQKYDFSARSKVDLIVSDPWKYEYPTDNSKTDSFIARYSFDYDLRIPIENRANLYPIMRQDLMRFFNLDAYIERKKIKCIVLEQLPGEVIINTKGGKEVYDLSTQSDKVYTLKNVPLRNLVEYLRYLIKDVYKIELPLETAIPLEQKIDATIDKRIAGNHGLELLRSELLRYNLRLVEILYETEVLVIKEKQQNKER